MVQVTVTSASEIAYLQQVAQGQVAGASATEVKAAQGILAQLAGMSPSQQDSWLAKNLPLPGSLVPGSSVPDSELDAAINNALDHYWGANNVLSGGGSTSTPELMDLSPDDIFAILAKAAIRSANGELRNAESSREAAYQMAAAAQQQQASDLRRQADAITAGAAWNLAFTCCSAAVSIGCAVGSASATISAASAPNQVQAAQFTARATVLTQVGNSGGSVLAGGGGMVKATFESAEKGYEADSASEGALADSFKQTGAHADSLVSLLQGFTSSVIQSLQGYQDAHNQALQAATRA